MTRKITAIAALAAVAVVGAWYMMLWKPVNRQVAAANSRLAAAQSSRMQAAVLHSSLLSMAAKLPAEQAKGAALTAAAPTDLDVAGVIDQVNAIAAASGVTWQSESQTQAAPISTAAGAKKASAASSSLSSSTLTLSVTGSYAQVLGFLQRLQSMPRLVQVSTLTLGGGGSSSTSGGSGPSTASGTGSITTQISATIYVDPTPIPAVPKIKS